MKPTALVNTRDSFSPPPSVRERRRAGRRQAYRLRRVAARLLPQERVCKCGQRVVTGQAAIRVKDGRASWGGLQTCGSVWLCPTCAAKIAEGRREELIVAGDRHIRVGGSIYMAAFTFSHKRWHNARALRRDLAAMWSQLIAGRPWQKAKAKSGLVGVVRAIEVTHGKNGWHPHIHALFLLDGDDAERAAELGLWLFERWDRIVQAAGYDACNPEVWRFERAAHYDAAADYVVKGNYDSELTRGHMKRAKEGGRSPWQLLEDAERGDRLAAKLFRDFAAAFKGARQVTWSYGLRDHFGLDERSDEAIAADEVGEVIGYLPARVYARVAYRGLGAAVLDAAEEGGWDAVVRCLKGWGLWWGGEPYPGFDRAFGRAGTHRRDVLGAVAA